MSRTDEDLDVRVRGDDGHTVIPYRAEMSGSAFVLHVWNPNRPYLYYPDHYDQDQNKIVITAPNSWHYDQNLPSYSGGIVYDGSDKGWFFAIPTSLEIHKGRQPMSPGLLYTAQSTLFVEHAGTAVTQIEDDEGRRLYTSNGVQQSRGDLEKASARQLLGVTPWLCPGGAGGDRPGELFLLERPAGSSPLNVSLQGGQYKLMHLSSGHLTELTAKGGGKDARDLVRLEHLAGNDHSITVSSKAAQRHFDLHHLRCEARGAWKSVRVRNELAANNRLRVLMPIASGDVEISGTERHDFDIEFKRYDGVYGARCSLTGQRIPAGRTLRVSPADWQPLSR
jgi:hypothetical protein